MAWPADVERRCHPLTRRRADRDARSASRRSQRYSSAPHRGGRRWDSRRLHLSAQRQSAARPEIRLQVAWFKRLSAHARKLLREDVPVVLAGDYNVAPTAIDIYPPTSWDDDALVRPESR